MWDQRKIGAFRETFVSSEKEVRPKNKKDCWVQREIVKTEKRLMSSEEYL